MGDKIKLYFDKEVLGKRADKQIDFDKSHLEIDLKEADVVWVQYIKGHHSSSRRRSDSNPYDDATV